MPSYIHMRANRLLRSAQRQQELSEMQARRTAAQRGLELGQQELVQTRPLLATGAVSQVDILRLERDTTRSRGCSGR